MNKKTFFGIVLFFVISFLYVILLDKDYNIALNSLMILFGILPVFIGINNSFHYTKISIGLTRKEIANKYVVDLAFTIILGIIYLIIINLFAYLVYKEINVLHKNVILTTIFLYSFTVFLSSLIMFIYNIFFIFKKISKSVFVIIVLVLIVVIMLLIYSYLYIKMLYLIGILISIVLFIIFSFINKTLTLKKKM